MLRNAPTLVLLAAGLAALAGCSRTDDGTVVPTYRMTLDRYAGIPVLTMRRTPLGEPGEPSAAMETQAVPSAFPPAPPPPVSTPPPASAAPLAKPRPHRTAARRTAPPAEQSTPPRPLVCQNRNSGERAVSILCE